MDDNKQKDAASLVDGWLEEIMKKMDIPEEPAKTGEAEATEDVPAADVTEEAPAAEATEEAPAAEATEEAPAAEATEDVSDAEATEDVSDAEVPEEAPVDDAVIAPTTEEVLPEAEDISVPAVNDSPTIFFTRPDASALEVKASDEEPSPEEIPAGDVTVQADITEEGAPALEAVPLTGETPDREELAGEAPAVPMFVAAGDLSAPDASSQDDFVFPGADTQEAAAPQEPHPLDDPLIRDLLAREDDPSQDPLNDPLIQELLANDEAAPQEDAPTEDTAVEDAPIQESIAGVPILSDNQLYAASEEAEAVAEEAPAAPTEEVKKDKLRPKWKKGYGLFGLPHIASTLIWLALILAIGISLARTIWLCAADLLALGKTGKAVSITVDQDDQMSDIAIKLKDAGLIEYPKLFERFVKITGKGEKPLVGTIDFSEEMVYDYNALVNALTFRGVARVTVEVMIPEGYNCAQMFALLEENGVCSAAALERYAADGELESYWFLDGVERGHKYCLEGFLFPDTYEFYINDEPERVIHKLLDGFEQRFSNRMVDKFVALNQKTGLKLTLRDVVTMASIVEKEKASEPEGYDIASVFYNRLRNPGSYPLLQSDATIKYDVDFRSKGELITDAQINASPYNTYTQKGLPPGPIANPGLSSLDAALDPNDTSYYFFIFDQAAGIHRFSKTLSEHNAWAKKLGLD